MRKLIVSNLVSLDGFISGSNGEIDWFVNIADKEFESYSINLINSIDTMLFGRVTYQLMESYWPTATTATDDQRIIDAMNNSNKIVFSKTLEKVDWKNARLIKGKMVEEVKKLKDQPGKNMIIYGSGSIVSTLTQAGLIDDCRIFVAPIILGSGKPLFKDIKSKFVLKLVDSRAFTSGLFLLHYLFECN
jgi:dihydrofolate reductase